MLTSGVVDPYGDGHVFYNTSVFTDGFDKLYLTAEHEGRHSADVISGKNKNRILTKKEMNEDEFRTPLSAHPDMLNVCSR